MGYLSIVGGVLRFEAGYRRVPAQGIVMSFSKPNHPATMPPPEWMTIDFQRQLQPFKDCGITATLLDAVESYVGHLYKDHFVRYTVRAGQLFHRAKPAIFPQYILERFQIMTEVFTYLAPTLPDLEFEIYLGDGFTGWMADCPAPVFAFSKHQDIDTRALLLPDPHSISKAASLRDEVAAGNAKYPWHSKIQKAFWRGTTTGEWLTLTGYQKNVRFKAVLSSIEYPGEIDAAFTNFHEVCEPELKALAEQRGYVRPWVAVSDHMSYKYILVLDGFTSPWPRFFWGTHSNSTLFKQNSKLIGWFDSQVQPEIHYLPVAENLSDLARKVEFARNNDSTMLRISENAREFASKFLTNEQMYSYISGLLTSYASLYE